MNYSRKLRVGEWVEVRSKEEILQTLDKDGQIDGLPFMPEMYAYCGRRFRVYKRAHKTCDTVFPIRGRRMANAVHLDTRCDGQAHGGCQASCLIFWKEAWLKRVAMEPAGRKPPNPAGLAQGSGPEASGRSTEQALLVETRKPTQPQEQQPSYICQATRIPYATTPLAWWDMRQYVEDYTSGNVGIRQMLFGAIYSGYYQLSEAGIGLGRMMRWLYDTFHPLWRGTPWPRKTGTIPVSEPTPNAILDLRPGELVRVKSHQEILKTLTVNSKNRGMSWDAEMVPFCGGTYRVMKRVTQIIDERTGNMLELKNPCIILEGVFCGSRYSYCRMFCPRSIYSYWREIWLERVDEKAKR